METMKEEKSPDAGVREVDGFAVGRAVFAIFHPVGRGRRADGRRLVSRISAKTL